MADSHDGRFPTNSSAIGFASSRESPSNVPALIILLVPYVSVSRHMVVPQSPQKNDVTVLPLLAVVLNSLGLPLVNTNPSPSTITLVENTEPVVLRQSRQKHRAWAVSDHNKKTGEFVIGTHLGRNLSCRPNADRAAETTTLEHSAAVCRIFRE